MYCRIGAYDDINFSHGKSSRSILKICGDIFLKRNRSAIYFIIIGHILVCKIFKSIYWPLICLTTCSIVQNQQHQVPWNMNLLIPHLRTSYTLTNCWSKLTGVWSFHIKICLIKLREYQIYCFIVLQLTHQIPHFCWLMFKQAPIDEVTNG
jgi:hypothetical protein